jgi:hypothetical protein
MLHNKYFNNNIYLRYRRNPVIHYFGKFLRGLVPRRAASCIPTYSHQHANLIGEFFLYVSPFPTLLNDILLHTTYYDYASFTSTSIGSRKEATESGGLNYDIIEAWKRRMKKKLP